MLGMFEAVPGLADAGAIVARAAARALRPHRKIKIVDWAREHFVLPDGPHQGEKFDPDQTPYCYGILDCLEADHPANVVVLKSSSQVAKTTFGLIFIGHTIDVDPCRLGVVFPSLELVDDFNAEKLQPAIEASDALRGKVADLIVRSGKGSTARRKRFPGGSVVLAGANSTKGLRARTWKRSYRDEVSDWPVNLSKQGDPMKMADARHIAYHASGDWKVFNTSTPTVLGACKITELFEAGDQRYYHVPCPHCGRRQRLVFRQLKFHDAWPYDPWYECQHCRKRIDEGDKYAMLLEASRYPDKGWIATQPGPGRYPSFHIDALSSNLETWENIAKEWREAQGDAEKLQTFFNLILGEAWDDRGEAPDWQKLYDRSRDEQYPLRRLPAGALVITGAADVQKLGIWYEIVAWGPGLESWSIDYGYLPGDTADPNDACWRDLDAIYARAYPDAYGNRRRVDAFAVDAGYLTGDVCAWTRKRARCYAVDGQPGWKLPPIGVPKKKDITLSGRRRRRGGEAWPVGVYGLKAKLYAQLRKPGPAPGAEGFPPGYCHFSQEHEETYFRQLTAEHLVEKVKHGRTVREWDATGENHLHDCRVYNLALAAKLGLFAYADEQWQALARARAMSPRPAQGSLLADDLRDIVAALDDQAIGGPGSMPTAGAGDAADGGARRASATAPPPAANQKPISRAARLAALNRRPL